MTILQLLWVLSTHEIVIIIMCVCVSCSVVSDSLRPQGLYILSGSFVHGILQARTLEWLAVPFSRGSSRPGDWIRVPHITGRLYNSNFLKEDSLPLLFVFAILVFPVPTFITSLISIYEKSLGEQWGYSRNWIDRILCPHELSFLQPFLFRIHGKLGLLDKTWTIWKARKRETTLLKVT